MQHSHAFYSFIHRHRRACLIGGAMLGGVIIAAVVLYSILQNIAAYAKTSEYSKISFA
mgnify:CR=1 FL=1